MLGEVSKEEDIKISDEDVNKEIRSLAQNYNEEQQKKMMELLANPQNQMSLASNIAFKKAIERMTAIACGRGEETAEADKDQNFEANVEKTESDGKASEEEKAAGTTDNEPAGEQLEKKEDSDDSGEEPIQ